MPLNLIKVYADLLDIDFMQGHQRRDSLFGIFKRDIEENNEFKFRAKKIYPVKSDKPAMQTLFDHLTCRTEVIEEDGNKIKKRNIYDPARSKRLHWIRYHIEEQHKGKMEIFSAEERIENKNRIRTYLYDVEQKYVIVLEPQRTNHDYYFITAYYLDEPWAEKGMAKRLRKKLPDLL